VLGGGLTLSDQQKEFFMAILRKDHPELVGLYARLYPAGSYAQAVPWRTTGLRIRECCQQAGISDRIPRPIIPGEKRSLNKKIVESLANQCYRLELENAPGARIWAYRKAAWVSEALRALKM
jgi:hypothetical protein